MAGNVKQTPMASRGQKTPNPQNKTTASPTRPPSGFRASRVLGTFAAVLFVLAGSTWAWSCSKDKPSSPSVSTTPSHSQPSVFIQENKPSPVAVASAPADASAVDDTPDEVPEAPWEGPWVGALVPTAPVYVSPFRTRENMIGYLRHGTKAPVTSTKPLQKDNCKEGWYRLHPYGFVCGSHVTTNLNHARFQAGIVPPDLEALVPYKYAYNNRNGTPLYRRIPTAEEMDTYEPDRRAEIKAKEAKAKEAKAKRTAAARGEHANASPPSVSSVASAVASSHESVPSPSHSSLAVPRSAAEATTGDDLPLLPLPGEVVADAGLDDAQAQEPEEKPWWMRDEIDKSDLTLDHMHEGSDAVLAKRMARGFFVAVDKTFRKNGRFWYHTTEGLLAPADRMSINGPPTFQGVELIGQDAPSLPVGWTRVSAAKYTLGNDGKTFRRKGTVERFTMVSLTGKQMTEGSTQYVEAKAGFWLRGSQVASTAPGPAPSGLLPKERWIDINLSTQTLVAFEGDTPVFATMVSTGKKGQTKKTDHSTVKGTFRVREKHVAATMDGDGAAPGEGPYSIQDVPYVLYFERSYAVHAAFWHNNFGTRMSHGCVNMAPADAKRIFFWSAPLVPPGWHGAWSTKEHPGSFVVVHD
ncbi:MAG TPA: L,D-transpeptidase [Polyangiaceae bacterium]|nr:MAG: L,D-transpeptidase catalytic domain [Deltaproteobacteria bacterium ADurb.Bin207]HNS97556.1 L,D-transpeptidase [Polyangiaceae bacterium]HNZ21830.1 L,D-transpeptidase [Polyangiaceae bacterium]HOD23899.1 L,D-transpeptidase [Polyangiaceae bacterium]HOE48708.1 L,D-transpeptidase [Polyangiaceae bacterium]